MPNPDQPNRALYAAGLRAERGSEMRFTAPMLVFPFLFQTCRSLGQQQPSPECFRTAQMDVYSSASFSEESGDSAVVRHEVKTQVDAWKASDLLRIDSSI